MLIQELTDILQDETHIFQDTYFESSQIRLLILVHLFEIQIMLLS